MDSVRERMPCAESGENTGFKECKRRNNVDNFATKSEARIEKSRARDALYYINKPPVSRTPAAPQTTPHPIVH